MLTSLVWDVINLVPIIMLKWSSGLLEAAINEGYYKHSPKQDQMYVWAQEKRNPLLSHNASRRFPPSQPLALAGWSALWKKAWLFSTLIQLQWFENIQRMSVLWIWKPLLNWIIAYKLLQIVLHSPSPQSWSRLMRKRHFLALVTKRDRCFCIFEVLVVPREKNSWERWIDANLFYFLLFYACLYCVKLRPFSHMFRVWKNRERPKSCCHTQLGGRGLGV